MSGDAAAGNVMVGIGETYLPAFVLALTASHVASGLVQTVPLLAGAVLQLAAPTLLHRVGSYRRWVLVCVTVQAAAFLPLVATAVCHSLPVAMVFVAAAVYWGTGMATSPAWTAWAGTLVPERIRARYFARRALVCQAGVLIGFLAGGIALQTCAGPDVRLEAFALLFLVAAVARFVSVRFLARQGEPSPPERGPLGLDWQGVKGWLTAKGNGKTLFYLLAVQAAVQISGPYFTPYMLGHLEFSYVQYATLVCVAYLTKVLCLPALGRVADRWGAQRLLWFGGLAIIPIAGLWLVSDSFAYLVAAQVASGAAWAAFELAMLLLFFETIPRSQRVAVLTVYNVANAVAIVAGSMVGGGLLAALGENRFAYQTLFFGSTLARAAALLLMVRAPASAASPTAAEGPVLLRLPIGGLREPVPAHAVQARPGSGRRRTAAGIAPHVGRYEPGQRKPTAAQAE